MSERDDELELQALERQLDDAFATTRPRRDFEDELWVRMQASRPASNRIRDALAGFLQAVREVPAVPAAAVATLLVVALGVGLLAYSGAGRGGGATSQSASSGGAGANADTSIGGFGRLPSPSFARGSKDVAPTAGGPLAPEATGALRYIWTGTLTVGAAAPVYRYREPTAVAADEFASSLGAVQRGRPSGLLGTYSASDYTLNVRGTLQSPPSSPTYFIIASPSMPAVDAAGAGPADVATIFLAAHSLVPDWPNTVIVDAKSAPARVRLARQFPVAGYGQATLVDAAGEPYGVEVDVQGARPILVSGLLPVSLDTADYRIVSPQAAIQPLLNASPAAAPSPAPVVQLTRAELVYVLVPAGEQSYYEPAYLFTGTLQVAGAASTQRVLVPAVDPSQRTP